MTHSFHTSDNAFWPRKAYRYMFPKSMAELDWNAISKHLANVARIHAWNVMLLSNQTTVCLQVTRAPAFTVSC